MVTNADEEKKEEVEETSFEEDLRQAKESETTKAEEEELAPSEEDAQSEESPAEEEAQAEPEATFTKNVPSIPGDTPQEYLANLEKSYSESTKEALRLKDLVPKPTAPESVKTDEVLTPEQLYIRQKQDEEIGEAFSEIQKDYPQVKDKVEYDRFTAMAQTVGKNITDAEKRLPPPKEVYAKTVVLLGWTQGDSQEKLGAAMKDGAASPKISSGASRPAPKSKVTDKMVAYNRRWYPGKTDAEIREELEPHVQ